jgi:exodeoxyribonuclease III
VKLISWNVNSVRQRLPRLIAMLGRHDPDVVCLQETKVGEDGFPVAELTAAGYRSAVFGQRAYNGVAILAKDPIDDGSSGFPGDPVPHEARVVAGTVGGTRVIDVYVVNGKAVGDPAYDTKLRWLSAFAEHLERSYDPSAPLIVAGDFNVAPSDLDVYDPVLWAGKNLASEPERSAVRRLLDWGLVDLGRAAAGETPGPFTFWDYRMGAFHRGWGLRIDLLLATDPLASRLASVAVDRDERKPTSGEGKPSDHAPVILTLRD